MLRGLGGGPKGGLSKAWGVLNRREGQHEVITFASLDSLHLISAPFCSSAEEEEPPGRRVQRKYGRVHHSPWRDGRGLAEVPLLRSRPCLPWMVMCHLLVASEHPLSWAGSLYLISPTFFLLWALRLWLGTWTEAVGYAGQECGAGLSERTRADPKGWSILSTFPCCKAHPTTVA